VRDPSHRLRPRDQLQRPTAAAGRRPDWRGGSSHIATSTGNTRIPENPDPSTWVYWGDQTWDEMMQGSVELIYDDPVGSPSLLEEMNDWRKFVASRIGPWP
jgi:hypothetical protein